MKYIPVVSNCHICGISHIDYKYSEVECNDKYAIIKCGRCGEQFKTKTSKLYETHEELYDYLFQKHSRVTFGYGLDPEFIGFHTVWFNDGWKIQENSGKQHIFSNESSITFDLNEVVSWLLKNQEVEY